VINVLIPEFFNGIKGFDSETQLRTSDLYFEDSKTLNDELTAFSGGALFSILLTVAFILGVIIATFMRWSKEKGDINKEQEKTKTQGNSGSSLNKVSRSGEPLRSPRKRKSKQKPCSERLIKCFSIQENLKILFTRRAPSEDASLEALNGIRCMTLVFVIIGNTYFYILKGPL
jgi:hypothetical protein